MSQSAAVQTTMMFSKEASERKHRFRILIAWIVSMAFVGAFAAYGFDYYTLRLEGPALFAETHAAAPERPRLASIWACSACSCFS